MAPCRDVQESAETTGGRNPPAQFCPGPVFGRFCSAKKVPHFDGRRGGGGPWAHWGDAAGRRRRSERDEDRRDRDEGTAAERPADDVPEERAMVVRQTRGHRRI